MRLNRLKLLVFNKPASSRRNHERLIAVAHRHVLDCVKTTGKKVRQIRDDQGDRPSSPAFQHTRRVIGRIANFGDRLHDFGACRGFYAWIIVNDARDRHHSHIRFFGNIDDRGRPVALHCFRACHLGNL
jgi:hypothetical protein